MGHSRDPVTGCYRNDLPALLAFLGIGFLIYSNSLHNPFVFDDSHFVSNPHLLHLFNFKDRWNYWPTRSLTFFSFAVNYHVGRLDVFGYHLFNLLVHLAATVFVWRLVLLTFSTPAMKGEKIADDAKWIAFFSALVFLVHPLQTEGVVYIFQRATCLASLFYIATIYWYAKARSFQFKQKAPNARIGCYTAACVAALMAMFTKEIAVTLPVVLWLYEVFFLRFPEKRSWKPILPFAGIALIIPVLMFFGHVMARVSPAQQILAAEPAMGKAGSYSYLCTQFRVIVTYLRLLFVPWGQHLDYDFPIAKTFFEPSVLMSFLVLLGILVAAKKAAKKYKMLSFSIFWFFVTLLPEWVFIPASDILSPNAADPAHDVIFEHRCYLPMVGYGIFLACVLHYFFRAKKRKMAAAVLSLSILGLYGVLTYRRNEVWADEVRLWSESIRFSPNKAMIYLNRGWAYSKTGSTDLALADYDRALQLFPRLAKAYSNRGAIYGDRNELDLALADYNRALEIDHGSAVAYTGRGVIYFKKGDFVRAVDAYGTAIAIEPTYAEAYYDRAYVYDIQGQVDHATVDYRKAIELNPGYSEAYNNLGLICLNQGDVRRSLVYFDKALESNPGNASARLNRTTALEKVSGYQ